MDRRGLLTAGATLAAGVLAGCAGGSDGGDGGTGTTTAAATTTTVSEPDYGGWFDGVDNYESTVDMRDSDAVTVTVGAEGNGGNVAFDPPAVRVSPGTEVTWEWTGDGGAHNVVADDGSYRSGDPVAEASTTFSHTFPEAGVSKYVCELHRGQGMKGAVVVGTPGDSGATNGSGGPATTTTESSGGGGY
jgi:halocyanin-like protein